MLIIPASIFETRTSFADQNIAGSSFDGIFGTRLNLLDCGDSGGELIDVINSATSLSAMQSWERVSTSERRPLLGSYERA